MGANSAISWTDHTFNPWWGCTKVSPGCANCYAETLAHRFGAKWGPAGTRRMMADSTWRQPITWNRKAGERRRVFCASMADVFEENPQVTEARRRLWELIDATPMLDWLLLTKRPENIERMVPGQWLLSPPANVWYGTSVETQEQADSRLPKLAQVPAALRFLSCEPLLGPVTLAAWLGAVQWVITGGESGPRARDAQPAWFRAIRDECCAHGTPFFHKQNGGTSGTPAGGELLDGRLWHEMPELEPAIYNRGTIPYGGSEYLGNVNATTGRIGSAD